MILDDGGDAPLLVHLGLRAERGDTAFLDRASNEEEEVLFAGDEDDTMTFLLGSREDAAEARRYLEFLHSPEAAAILRKHGFSPP